MGTIYTIFCITLGYIGLNLMLKFFLGILLMDFGAKFPKIKVTLPKNKKYLSGKHSPIYKLRLCEEFDAQAVEKYELRYDEVEDIVYCLGMFLAPLFNLRTIAYQYHSCRELRFYVKSDKILQKIGDMELSEFYEKEMKLLKDKEAAKKAVEDEKQSKVDKLNSIFNENYG